MTYLYKPLSYAEIEEFLREPRHGVIGTTNWVNQRPQLNTVWWLYEQGRIWFSFFPWANRIQNIHENPNVCLCIPTPYPQADKQVILYGKIDRISRQGEDDYDEALDYRMTQQFSASEEVAQAVHAADLKDGPWIQLSFAPDLIYADDYDNPAM